MNDSFQQLELDRRQFLRMSLMTSAMLMVSPRALEGQEISAPGGLEMSAPGYPAFAALHPLPPGVVRPEGWLRVYLEKQAAQLGSKLTQVSQPFTSAYWAGEEVAESWWPWEQGAYWIDGATRLALVLQDERLLRQAQAPIKYTLSHADPDGYLGPNKIKSLADGYGRWPHTVFFRSLSAASDGHGAPGIPEAMQKHYISDSVDYSKASRNFTNIEDMLWCYERTGDARLLALAEKAWREYSKKAGGPSHCDLSAMRVYADTPINAHGCDYIEAAKQPAILYLYTGRPEYLRFALAAQRRIFDHHMLIDGIPSTSEWYRTTTSLDSHETCDITDHTWAWGYMLMATGDGIWGDRIERACFNAGFGAIKKDWKALQYFSCPNQFLATLNSDHNFPDRDSDLRGGRQMAYQPNPGQKTACCGGNVHRLFPNYVIRMWMKDANGGVAATLYGPSRVKTTVGAEHQEVEIVQETDYPFGEEIHFTINAKQAVSFPLSLRIPAWCAAPKILINGKSVSLPEIKRGFVVLDREFRPADTITLILPMKVAVTHWPQDGIGIEHGPLVYSLGIKEQWTSTIEPNYSTAEYPSWSATPESPWNYGLAIDPERLLSQVKLQRKPMTPDPWVDPPVALVVPVKKIENWELQSNPDNADDKFTPPLPDLSASKISQEVERVTLVPYGSTHLRVTIFPKVSAG
jgi:hypothetical protein